MKKIIFFLLIITHINGNCQDSLWITNFNLKAGTIRLTLSTLRIDQVTAVTLFKWNAGLASNPGDNANVQIDSIPTTTVASIYSLLMDYPSGLVKHADFINDFRTSIQSKRNANSYLNFLCTIVETFYTNKYTDMRSTGDRIGRGL
jgi:hypothetical protein